MEKLEGDLDVAARREVGVEKVKAQLSWIVLTASALFGIAAAVLTTLPPLSWFIDPLFVSKYSIMGAWGTTWVGFNVFALVLTLIPYRRGERWAWYTLWMLPLLWLSLFALAPDLRLYLALAIFTALGLILPYRRFFPSRGERSV
jgi:hypothetical protein